MKRITITFAPLLLFSSFITAQNSRFGFTAGATFANFKTKADLISMNYDSKMGITAGILWNAPLGDKFSIQPELNYLQKGIKCEESYAGSTLKLTMNNNYLELPVNFLYNMNGFFIGAGPSIAFALSGKGKTEVDGQKEEEDIKFGSNDDDDMKGTDIGVNMIAGYRLPGGLLFSFNFNQGLNNLDPLGDDEYSVKSHYFGIRIGYMLKGKDK